MVDVLLSRVYLRVTLRAEWPGSPTRIAFYVVLIVLTAAGVSAYLGMRRSAVIAQESELPGLTQTETELAALEARSVSERKEFDERQAKAEALSKVLEAELKQSEDAFKTAKARLLAAELEAKKKALQASVQKAVNQAIHNSSPANPELGAYMAKVRKQIGSIWYPKVENQMELVSVGVVRVRVSFHADGNVDVTPLDGDKLSDAALILRSISLNSIKEAAPFDPLPQSLRDKFGDTYVDEFTFQVYQE